MDAHKVLHRLRRAREVVAQREKEQQQKNKKAYDSRRRKAVFYPGDLVYLWTPSRAKGKTTKLLHRYHGPFRLLRKVSENNWEVVDRTGRKRDVVNVERLKLCHTRVGSDEDADDESANSDCGVDGVHELGGSVRVSAKPKGAVASTVTNNDHETSGESATEAYSYSESAHQSSHAGPQTETKAVRHDYDSETEIYYSADESVN
ncbi:hypothetical protein V5799_032795 [Amblyomma americanum]|uniref:Integrase p58-like C-terminal domain-containing protein n=1 Tax=Amblyomma americanum TaxID=6943 RepID=A0AAQ4DQ55_AMBAM